MSWEDRIKQAAITSPSGVRLIYDYVDVSRVRNKKNTAFEFADSDGTYVQQSGNSGKQFPLRVFFSGDDYDLEANLFELMLEEAGLFVLEHPMYGNVTCTPLGTIIREDKFVSAANQAEVQFTMWETIDRVYPFVGDDLSGDLSAAIDAYNAAQAQSFADLADVDTAIERISLANQITSFVDNVQDNLEPIYKAQADVQARYEAIEQSITRGIDVLVNDPLTLAAQTLQLVQAPARALTLMRDRVQAYGTLFVGLIDTVVGKLGNDSREKNAFLARDINASGALSAYAVVTLNGQFKTQEDAQNTAIDVLSKLDELEAWRAENFTLTGQIDDGSAFQALQSLVAQTAGYLVQESFGLLRKKELVLDSAHTMVDLAGSIYGVGFEDKLNEFIDINQLVGTELLEIPKGRRIVYYS